MTPLVSIVVPTRNRLGSLQRAVASIEAQRFRDFEVLVVDDGSTDGTAAWLHAQRPEIRVFATEGSGAAGARNRGLEQARGELIAFLDDDDAWQPSYLSAQVGHLEAHPNAALCYADHLEIDAAGRASRPDTRALLTYESSLVRLLAESFIHTLSVVVCRRAVLDRIGRFDESLVIVHDLEWYARILAGGESFVHLPRTLVRRATPGGLVSQYRQWCREERAVLDRSFADNPAHGKSERLVRAYRSLFFARVGLASGDLLFGLPRLAEAFLTSPRWTMEIGARRLLRRVRLQNAPETWDAAAEVSAR